MKTNPTLKPPGHPLPLIQRALLRCVIGPFLSKRDSWETMRSRYELLVSKIIQVSESISETERQIPILVDPIVGLEDSSRFWSVDMTLEHLVTVSRHMESMILVLARGEKPTVVADTAKVKPKENEEKFLTEFKAYAPLLYQNLDLQMKNRESQITHRHPWFGMINAKQWYWVLAGHQGIHYQQIKQIVKQLKNR